MAAGLEKRFHEILSESELFSGGGPLLVAVSGGADSVALLHLLSGAAVDFSLSLVVAHLDHGLRPESAQDAEFVRLLAGELGWPVVAERIEVSALLEQGKGGPEEIARNARRGFLERVASEEGCSAIVLGHHQEDQAETFLLRLLRGSGTMGLSGMRFHEPPYVRPLLEVTRGELLRYLKTHNFSWREDTSNSDPSYTRNRIRSELLPLLESFNPQISAHLARLCRRFAEDEAVWQELVDAELSEAMAAGCGGVALSVDLLRRLPAAWVTRLLRAALERVRGDLRSISSRHIEMMQALLTSDQPQGELTLPGAWVGRRYDTLHVALEPPVPPDWSPREIAGDGIYPLPNGRELIVKTVERSEGESREYVEFCADQVTLPIQIRTFLPGDRLRPDGMAGSRKLHDLFVDLKLTKEQRQAQPLLVCGEQILWVVGVRRCAGLRPSAGCLGKVLQFRVVP